MTISTCPYCVHYTGDLKCEAFPDGIPKEILNGDNDHSIPLEEQENELTFERNNNG